MIVSEIDENDNYKEIEIIVYCTECGGELEGKFTDSYTKVINGETKHIGSIFKIFCKFCKDYDMNENLRLVDDQHELLDFIIKLQSDIENNRDKNKMLQNIKQILLDIGRD